MTHCYGIKHVNKFPLVQTAMARHRRPPTPPVQTNHPHGSPSSFALCLSAEWVVRRTVRLSGELHPVEQDLSCQADLSWIRMLSSSDLRGTASNSSNKLSNEKQAKTI